jgi:hypothetical protein
MKVYERRHLWRWISIWLMYALRILPGRILIKRSYTVAHAFTSRRSKHLESSLKNDILRNDETGFSLLNFLFLRAQSTKSIKVSGEQRNPWGLHFRVPSFVYVIYCNFCAQLGSQNINTQESSLKRWVPRITRLKLLLVAFQFLRAQSTKIDTNAINKSPNSILGWYSSQSRKRKIPFGIIW